MTCTGNPIAAQMALRYIEAVQAIDGTPCEALTLAFGSAKVLAANDTEREALVRTLLLNAMEAVSAATFAKLLADSQLRRIRVAEGRPAI